MRKRAEIEIILKSDLCVGSGYSYAGIIDSDVCYNENGIPYIPARRLKGCLREVAELIKISAIDEIFGIVGDSKSSFLTLSNAYPKNYENLNEEITLLKFKEYKEQLTTQKVLDQYTYVKAQTAIDIDTGIAKENSLRYIRVVKHYSALDKEEMCFTAKIEYDEAHEEDIENAVKGLKHIGMNRSRGLGNIQCKVINKTEIKENTNITLGSEEKRVCLSYTVKNIAPLMLSGNSDDTTDNFIKGQTVIGAIAGKYLSENGRSAQDELFYDLFLSGKVKYTNLYISQKVKKYDKETYISYTPAPLFINTLKKSGKIVNITKKSNGDTFGEGSEYDAKGGNQPKKLKGKYIYFSENNKDIAVTSPVFDMVYHHSKRAEFSKNVDRKKTESGLLYTMQVVREGQYFSGSIIGEKKYIDFLYKMLDTLNLGKSKSAQYGECKVVNTEITDYSVNFPLKKDDIVFVNFESDGIFIDKKGSYTVATNEISSIIGDKLGIKGEMLEEYTFLQAEIVTGYSTVLNLKRPSFLAVGMGSTIAYKLSKDVIIRKSFVGEKNTEGFGKIKIYQFSELPVAFNEMNIAKISEKPNACRGLLESIMLQDFLELAKVQSLNVERIEISPATLGRLTLMFTESLRENKKPSKAFEDLKNRIDSIKRIPERTKIVKFLTNCLGEDKKFGMIDEPLAKDIEININKIIGKGEASSLYEKMQDVGIDNMDEKIRDMWIEYLGNILTYQRRRVDR